MKTGQSNASPAAQQALRRCSPGTVIGSRTALERGLGALSEEKGSFCLLQKAVLSEEAAPL